VKVPGASSPSVVGILGVVCDLDGVLRHFDVKATHQLEVDAGLEPGSIAERAFDPALLQPAITGAVSDEAWRDSIVDALSHAIAADDARALVARWSESPGRIDPDVLRLLRAVRAIAPVVILTNATSRLRRDLEALGAADEFDAVVSSAETGVPKPESGAFRAAQTAVGESLGRSVAEANLLFVDDDVRNVDAAAAFGWNAVEFTNPDSFARSLFAYGLLG
jgi:putative hydrolase of the HAD superfamily